MLRDGLEGRPKYSMASRHFLKESERSPGPAAYFPTKWALDNRPPEYTMGMKLRYEKGFVTPGTSVAACYKLAPLNVEARTTVCLSVCLHVPVVRLLTPKNVNKTNSTLHVCLNTDGTVRLRQEKSSKIEK